MQLNLRPDRLFIVSIHTVFVIHLFSKLFRKNETSRYEQHRGRKQCRVPSLLSYLPAFSNHHLSLLKIAFVHMRSLCSMGIVWMWWTQSIFVLLTYGLSNSAWIEIDSMFGTRDYYSRNITPLDDFTWYPNIVAVSRSPKFSYRKESSSHHRQ